MNQTMTKKMEFEGTVLQKVGKTCRWRLGALSGLLFLALGSMVSPAWAEEVHVAVAANFLATFQVIAEQFEQETGDHLLVSPGSTGKLYVQIQHEAPFDLFFSADARRPELLEQEGLAVPGSRFTYAVGRLTLWSADPAFIKADGKAVIEGGNFEYLAIANPRTAPYGQAAKQTLQALNLWEVVQDRLVQGENIGQTFQFVFTGNAQVGFVALSQVLDPKMKDLGSRWEVPPHLYHPLVQQAVLLTRGQDNSAAKKFLTYIKSPSARSIIEKYGYSTK